jgi:hypothetical protein
MPHQASAKTSNGGKAWKSSVSRLFRQSVLAIASIRDRRAAASLNPISANSPSAIASHKRSKTSEMHGSPHRCALISDASRVLAKDLALAFIATTAVAQKKKGRCFHRPAQVSRQD